jgi:gluconolactonase
MTAHKHLNRKFSILGSALAMGGQLIFSHTPSRAQTSSQSIVAAGAKLEKLWDGGTHTEGVAVAPNGTVYFCDTTPTDMPGPLAAGHIYRWNRATGQANIFRSPANQANGMKFDLGGRMLVAESADGGGRRVTRTDMTNGKSEVVAAQYKGKNLNSVNDIAIDGQGRFYFSDPRYDGREPVEQPVQGIYRVDLDNSVHLILADVVPNGLAVSPDGRTLYVAEFDVGATDTRDLPPDVPRRHSMRLLAYSLNPDGTVGKSRTLVNYGEDLGADGLTVDARGNIYAAVGALGREGIRVYTPGGQKIATIPTPETPTNMAFGRGTDAKTLYITAGTGLYRIRTNVTGHYPGAK